MFENLFDTAGRGVVALGGAVGLTFCLAGGVAVGVVPQAGRPAPSPVRAEIAAPDVTPVTTPDTVAPTTVAPEVAAPAPVDTTPAAQPRATSTTEVTASSSDEGTPAATPAPAGAPAGPTTAARLTPTSAQVKAAIAQIGAGLPVSEAQAREFGNQVCTAFDQGQSASAVKATALQAAQKVPFVSVSAAQVDAAVRSAVQLFCPGYASKV